MYLALAALWKPATTREIAERARLDTSKCSAHLGRLMERGAVEVTGGSARRKLYYLGERLYNIYYLMRRARGPAPLVEALIRFMEGYYSPAQLNRALVELALGQAGTAIETINEVLQREGARFPEFRLEGHLVRAKAHLANGDHAECAQDVETSLAILPTLAPLPKEALDALSGLSVDLGTERMRDLILNSPASELLLPLTTALELEMGMEPRVAKEVEEVAEDIRRAMEAQREQQSG